MRGLPSCGKSFTARKLVAESGVVLETDQYFHTEIGNDPAKYDYDDQLMPLARDWNYARFQQAVAKQVSPIVVDRGNGRNEETRRYAQWAVDHGYQVELKEPESDWWQEIRILLKYKWLTGPALDEWAEKLSALSRKTHRVPMKTICKWMAGWKYDLTVEEILALPSKSFSGK